MASLFAGVVNTGILCEYKYQWLTRFTNVQFTRLPKQACWILIDLAIHPEWREKCKREIQDLLSGHLGDSSSETLSEKLGAIPFSV